MQSAKEEGLGAALRRTGRPQVKLLLIRKILDDEKLTQMPHREGALY